FLATFYFFFQAEDGIRDRNVTGVQTCALPIFIASSSFPISIVFLFHNTNISLTVFSIVLASAVIILHHNNIKRLIHGEENKMNQIGRASCRERGYVKEGEVLM